MPLAQRLLSVVGRSPSMVLGMLLLGCSSLCFGHSEDIARWFVKSDHSAYRRTSLGFFFTFRTLEGLGAAFAQLAATTVVMDSLPESTMGSVLGINEMVIALGYTIGPAVGGVLYSWHGFGLPFVMTGGLSLAASFVIALVLYGQHLKQKLKRARREERRRRRRDQQERADQNSFQEPLLGHGPELQRNRSDVHSPHTEQVVDSQFGNFVSTTSQVYSRTYTMQSTTTVGTIGEEDIERKVNAWKLLLDKDHLLAIVCTIMGCAAFSVQSPILAPNLMSVLHLSERDVGLVFTTISLSYAIAGPFVGYLGDKIGFRKLIGIGFICSGLVQMLLIGGPFGVKTDHHRTWKIVDVYVSFGLFGVAQAFGIVPLLPFMKEVASDEPGTSEVVAASFLTCTTISEVNGSTLEWLSRGCAWNSRLPLWQGLGSVLGSGLRVLMSYTWSMFAFGTTELALGLAAFLFWAVRNPRTSARFSIPPELA
eukprot:scaffold1206_cov388-Prasinococcus_capsulatus_cf.AAC.28